MRIEASKANDKVIVRRSKMKSKKVEGNKKEANKKRALFISFESFQQCSRLLWRIMLFAIDYLNVNEIILKKIILTI